MEFESIVSRMAEEMSAQMDVLLYKKLILMKNKASLIGETELAEILDRINLKNVAKTKRELEDNGYAIEIEYPKETYETKDGVVRATIDTDQIKIRVRKLILEV